jgi:hypothetical protein
VNNDDNGSGNDQSTIIGSFSPPTSIQDDEDIDTDFNKVNVVSYFHSSQRKFTIKSFSSGLVFGCAAVVLHALGESLLDIPLGKKTPDLQQEDRQQHLHIHLTKDLCYANSVDKITQVTPLPQRCVGSKNQLYAHPCPNKVLDLGCSTMRLEILRRFKNTGKDCPLSSSHTIIPNDPVTGTYTSDFSDDAFRAILLTVIGRPGLLGNYTRHNCKGYQDSYIPPPGSFHLLLKHMDNNNTGGSAASRFLNQQWKQPKSVNKYDKLTHFLQDYAKAHHRYFRREVLDQTYPSDGTLSKRRLFKDRWVGFLLEHCHSLVDEDNTKWHFQVGQAITYLESVYGNFLGDRSLDSIPMGSGSLDGWDILQKQQRTLSWF